MAVTPTSLRTTLVAGDTGEVADTNTRNIAINQLTNATTGAITRDTASSVVNVVAYGADATGVASSSTAVTAALAAVADGGTIYFPEGTFTWTGDVTVTRVRVTITGPGIIKGRFKVGSGSARLEIGCRFEGLKFVRPLDTGTYPVTGYAAGSYFIGLDRVRNVTITNCEFYGAAWPIYGIPNASAASHDTSMIKVITNHFNECDWAFYQTWHASSMWQALADSQFIGNIVNRSYVGMFYAQGVDGVQINDNVHFMINYASTTNARFPEKQQNIKLDYSDWVHIHDNNLFESGTESILMTNARVYNITGNAIAWPGQRVLSNAIDVTAGSGEWAQGVVTGNSIMYYTKSAIRLSGNHGEVQLGPNQVRWSLASPYYVGNLDGSSLPTYLPAVSSVNHYRYDLAGATGVVPTNIGVADSTISNTGFSDLYPSMATVQGRRTQVPRPNDLGMKGWTSDPGGNTSATIVVVATHYVAKVFISGSQILTNVLAGTTVAGTTAANSYFTLYDSSGNKIAGTQSADISSTWNSAASNKSFTLGAPVTVTDDWVYVSMWVNSAATAPTVVRSGSAAIVNLGTTSGVAAGPTSPRFGTAANAYTSSGTVAPTTLGTITGSSLAWIFGLS